jgi:hypothetical protein
MYLLYGLDMRIVAMVLSLITMLPAVGQDKPKAKPLPPALAVTLEKADALELALTKAELAQHKMVRAQEASHAAREEFTTAQQGLEKLKLEALTRAGLSAEQANKYQFDVSSKRWTLIPEPPTK